MNDDHEDFWRGVRNVIVPAIIFWMVAAWLAIALMAPGS